MLGSITYIITSISIALIVMGFTRTLSIEQALATIVVAVAATILGLTITVLATKGKTWVLKATKITGLFTVVHLFTLALPMPGVIIFTANIVFYCFSVFLLNKVLANKTSAQPSGTGIL